MNKKFLILLVSVGLIILSGIFTSCAGRGGSVPPIAGTSAATVEELRAALNDETVEVIFLTGDLYEVTDLVMPSGKRLIGPDSPDYPAGLSKRGNGVMMPEADATSGALIRIQAFGEAIEDVTISGVNFQLPDDYQWDNMHDFFMIFMQGDSDASSTLANITVENCTFDYTTVPNAPEGISLSTAVRVGLSEIYKSENIKIDNNTFKLKTSNTDANFCAIGIDSAANDEETGIVVSNNKIYGGSAGTGRAPTGIGVGSTLNADMSARDTDTVHVKLNNNRFYGKDAQGNVLNFNYLMSVEKNALDIQLDMSENEFGTFEAPIVSNEKLDNIVWLGFNFDYPTGVIEFTAESANNSFALQGGQFRRLFDTYFPDPNPYGIKVGTQTFTNTDNVSAALTTQENYIFIFDSVAALGECIEFENVPKIVYMLPGAYTDFGIIVNCNNLSVIGPQSPDYPASLAQGVAAFTPASDLIAFNLKHVQTLGEPENDEYYQRENIRFSGLTLTTPSGEVLDNLINFFEFGVDFVGGDTSERNSRDGEYIPPDWYLKNFSIDNCDFDFRETSVQNAGINCMIYNAEYCTFEDINISNNSFHVKNLESTYMNEEEEEKFWRIVILNGNGGSAKQNAPFKINNNYFSGATVDAEGTTPAYLLLAPDFGENEREYFFEIKNNQFAGNSYFERLIQTHNAKKMTFDFAGNQYGSVATPFRNDVAGNGRIVMFFLNDDNPITFAETASKNTYYTTTSDGTITFAVGVNYGGAVNIHCGDKQVSEEEIKDQLLNIVN